MLRSAELLGAHRTELFDLDGDNPRFDVTLKRVKKRRVIQQPLSDLAVEIIWEALTSEKQQYVFASPLGDMPMNRRVARKRGRLAIDWSPSTEAYLDAWVTQEPRCSGNGPPDRFAMTAAPRSSTEKVNATRSRHIAASPFLPRLICLDLITRPPAGQDDQ